MSSRKKYLTIKNGEDYYRLFHFEESTDQSIIIKDLWFAKSKSTYHANHGKMLPPFEAHQYGCNGKLIPESVSMRKKFITEYSGPFRKNHFNCLPPQSRIQNMSQNDIILDMSNRNIADYEIVCFSDKRKDLIESQFDNAVVVKLPLKTWDLIVGCFKKPRR